MILVVQFKSLPGKRAELAAVLAEAVTTAHPHGCIAHRVATANDDDDSILMYEEWTSLQAHEQFMASNVLAPFMPRIGALCAERGVSRTYDLVDAVPPIG